MGSPVPGTTPQTYTPAAPTAGVAVARGETASSSIAARAKAEVEARAVVALNRPRHVEMFRQRLLAACERSRFAHGAWYSKPVGGKPIEGLSIRFAEEAARHYGNLHIGAQVVFDDEERRVVKVVATDLESNNTYDSDVTIIKTVERRKSKDGDDVIRSRTNSTGQTVYIIRADDDQLLNKQAALVSKARRQLILQHIPSDISEEAAEVIAETRKSEVDKDPMAARRRMVDAFFALGVSPEQIEEFLGHALETITKAEIHYLGSIYTGMKEGESSWAEVMELKRGTKAPDAPAPQHGRHTSGVDAALDKAEAKAAPAAKAPVAETEAVIEAEPEPKPFTIAESKIEALALLNDGRRVAPDVLEDLRQLVMDVPRPVLDELITRFPSALAKLGAK